MKPQDAISVRKLPWERPLAEQAPLPQATTGMVPFTALMFWGMKIVWLGSEGSVVYFWVEC